MLVISDYLCTMECRPDAFTRSEPALVFTLYKEKTIFWKGG